VIPRGIGLALLAFAAVIAGAAEVIPPPPQAYFNDYASIVSPATAASLNQKLDQFERSTSSQIVVAIFPSMQSDSSVEDYTVRVAQSWHAGLKGKDNGAVLFIFVKSHQMYIQVGYGLEPTLTDAISKRIISDEIAPAFRRGDYDGGLTAGVNAMIAATRGEYHGTGHTVGDRSGQGTLSPVFFALIVIFIVGFSIMRSRAAVYHRGGRMGFGGFLPLMFLGGGGGGFGGGGGGGGGFGGGGGGFSGGGGGFGGGGAGGSW
jgi:uncharacterized protein